MVGVVHEAASLIAGKAPVLTMKAVAAQRLGARAVACQQLVDDRLFVRKAAEGERMKAKMMMMVMRRQKRNTMTNAAKFMSSGFDGSEWSVTSVTLGFDLLASSEEDGDPERDGAAEWLCAALALASCFSCRRIEDQERMGLWG